MEREDLVLIVQEALHAFIPRRGMGKYVDQIITVASPGVGIQIPIQIALQAGEGLLLDAFGWLVSAGAMTTAFLSLQMNRQAVPGYDRMTQALSPQGISWAFLTPIDLWCPPGSVVRVVLQNLGGVAVTVQVRLRGRFVSPTFGTR